jgi:hypothetical protein
MPRHSRFTFRRHALCALAGLSIAATALAGDRQSAAAVPLLATYQQECAACHVAFAPHLLPAASWRRVLSNLPRHYGADASLNAATVAELSTWLLANAGTGRRAREEPPGDRITRSAWFVREHAEVRAATWSLPAVKSPANCAACHPRADQGTFSEHDIRIPR